MKTVTDEAGIIVHKLDIIAHQIKQLAWEMKRSRIDVEFIQLAQPYYLFAKYWMDLNDGETAFGLRIILAPTLMEYEDESITNKQRLYVTPVAEVGDMVGLVYSMDGKIYGIYREESSNVYGTAFEKLYAGDIVAFNPDGSIYKTKLAE